MEIDPFDPELVLKSGDKLMLKSPELLANLSAFINELILNDFDKLVGLLYRLDIYEKKLKETLGSSTKENAGDLIARMILTRQIEKMESREKYKSPPAPSEEEQW